MKNEVEQTSLDELYDYLKRFSLSDSLYVIGVINSVFKYGFEQLERKGIPEGPKKWIDDNFKDNKARLDLMVQMTRLARFLLLSGANDYKKPILDTDSLQLQKAASLTASLFDEEVEGKLQNKRDLIRAFGRIGQWQFPLQINRSTVIGRAQLLFIEIPAELKIPYDFDQKMKEYFNIGVLEFIASGLALWITCVGVLKHKLTIQINALKPIITTESIKKFVELSTGTPEDYRRLIRGDDWKIPNNLHDIYGFDPFWRMPAVKVTRSKMIEAGSYVVPQLLYLLARASLGGFYLLSDKEKETAISSGQPGKNEFRESFGTVYRAYVGKQLTQAKSPRIFIDLDEEIFGDFKKPDFVIIEKDICVIFEVKTALLTVNSRTVLDEEATRSEIQRGSLKKAFDQLTEFEEEIKNNKVKDKRFAGVAKIIKVIVGFEDVYLANAFLLPLAKEIYGEQANNLQIATLSDIEITGTILANGGAVAGPLLEKVTNEYFAEWPFGNFIADKNRDIKVRNPILEKAWHDFMKRMSGKDFL